MAKIILADYSDKAEETPKTPKTSTRPVLAIPYWEIRGGYVKPETRRFLSKASFSVECDALVKAVRGAVGAKAIVLAECHTVKGGVSLTVAVEAPSDESHPSDSLIVGIVEAVDEKSALTLFTRLVGVATGTDLPSDARKAAWVKSVRASMPVARIKAYVAASTL